MSTTPDTAGSRADAARKHTRLLRRLIIWGVCLASYCITLILLRMFKSATGLDPFSVVIQGFIPVGAAGVAALAISGFMLAGLYFGWAADRWDLLFLMAACLLLQFVIIAVDYWALLLARPELVGHVSYARFFSWALTTPEYMVQSNQFGDTRAQAIGETGYILLLPRLGALMALAKLAHSRFEMSRPYDA